MPTALFLLATVAAPPPDLANLDFVDGLTHWKGAGFDVAPGPRVTSAEWDGNGRRGMLHRTFVVPPGTGTLHVSALASHDDDRLNLFVEAASRVLVPKKVRTTHGIEKSPKLLLHDRGKPRDYLWEIADRVGETLRIIVLDHTDEPGRHVVCSGFRLEPTDAFETQEFMGVMTGLARIHRLPAMETPFKSKHFLAVGNADEKFITSQLERCELMRLHFLNHFRVMGFKLTRPAVRLSVAIFSAQEGLEAYIGRPMSPLVTGFYHPQSNRLVIYDYGQNRLLVKEQERIEHNAKRLHPTDRLHVLARMDRETNAIRADANLSSIMHEAAHQMAFNTGLLNRDGDLPLWLVEGLATYCEATENGFWKGLGAMNPERLKTLARSATGEIPLLPLRLLVESDRWLHGPGAVPAQALMGYGQSWALVRMLMEEQSAALRKYCETIYLRRTPDHRLTDFGEVFGDLGKLEKRHREYVKRLLKAVP